MHFYHLHAFDWVDVVSSLKADPKATSALAQSISGYAKSSPGYFADVQKKVRTFVDHLADAIANHEVVTDGVRNQW